MIKKPRPTSPSQIGSPEQSITWEDIIGKNLMRGDYNPLRGVVGMSEDYNAALTGYRQTPTGLEQEPGFARALTLMAPGTGGGPSKVAGSGFKFSYKSKVAEDIADAFKNLGAAQRDAPEAAMLKVQHTMGGGVLNPVVEHVGDLTHRMTHSIGWGTTHPDIVWEKVNKTLRALKRPYGFRREMAENIRNSAEFSGISERQLSLKIDEALNNYAKEHAKLPAYNVPQYHAREAAISVGKKDWDKAIHHLEELEKMLKSGTFSERASKAFKDPRGNLISKGSPMQKSRKLGGKSLKDLSEKETTQMMLSGDVNTYAVFSLIKDNKSIPNQYLDTLVDMKKAGFISEKNGKYLITKEGQDHLDSF